MIRTLVLPYALRAQIGHEARAAFPRECCGLIEGLVDPDGARALALHRCTNVARAPDRFEIDPQMHIAVLRALRGRPHSVIGCYHSHPNGQGTPSARDAEGAGEEGFLWLIQAVLPDGTGELAAFVFARHQFHRIGLRDPF